MTINKRKALCYLDSCLVPPGDKIWRASGWASEGRAADRSGKAKEADVEKEQRVWLPDPPGEDGAAAPGAPGPSICTHENTAGVHILKLFSTKHKSISWLLQCAFYACRCVDHRCAHSRCESVLITDACMSVITGNGFACEHLPCLSAEEHILLFSEHLQRIRDLEDKTEIQRRQIKDLEEKVGHGWMCFCFLKRELCWWVKEQEREFKGYMVEMLCTTSWQNM